MAEVFKVNVNKDIEDTPVTSPYKHSTISHNILRIFETIPNFLFNTSEAKRDYQ